MPHAVALRSQALAARSAGEHGVAAIAWRSLLDTAPLDWGLALELRHDLQEAWHSADSDAGFRKAATAMPDDVWLDHYCASFGLPGSELDSIGARARSLRTRKPADARIEALIGHVARDRRDWTEATRAYTAASALDPTHPDWPGIAAECRQYQRLEARLAAASGHAADHEAFVINLDRNTDRLGEIARRFSGFPVQPQRMAAVDGNRLARAVVGRLAGDPNAPRGTLGCFLSHAAAWERLLAGSAGCALVLEDDAQPMLTLPAGFAALGLPTGWDLVWVNQRMQPQADPETTTGFTVHPLLPAIRALSAWPDAPGADGYLVSRAGARKLLDRCAADGFAGDVDCRMLAYSVGAENAGSLPPFDGEAGSRAALASFAAAERLQSYVLQPYLIRELSLRSSRIDADRLSAAR